MQGNQYFHQATNGYTVPFEYGPLLGFVAGFFVTLAKSPPFILMDCVYGAMLGFLLITGYNLFVLGMQNKPVIVAQQQARPDFHRIMALYREMQIDYERYEKAAREKQENGPIFMRTRSRMRSYSQ
jgi:hypothetical protein